MTDDGEPEEADAERDEDERASAAGGEESVGEGVEGRESGRTEDRGADRAQDWEPDRPGATSGRADPDDPQGGNPGEDRDRPAAASRDGQEPSTAGADLENVETDEREASGSVDDDDGRTVGADRPDGEDHVGDRADERAVGDESETSADVGASAEAAPERGPTPGSEPAGADGPTETAGSPGADESTAGDEGHAGADVPEPAAAGGEHPGGAVGEFDEVAAGGELPDEDVPEDVRSYDRFQKVDRASYDRVNEFLRDRTYITAREWAIARLCADFRTATGVEMTKIGENLPHLVPFMTDTYSPQAVNQARSAFEDKVRMAGATFLYGAMSGFFTADELDDIMYEVTEVAKFLLEVEGVELTVDEELDAEDRISAVMREVRQASEELRYDEVACPHCGEAFQPAED